jgi:hypothetical protein
MTRKASNASPRGLTIVKAPGGLPFLPNMERDDHNVGDPYAFELTNRGGVEDRGFSSDNGSGQE